MVHSLSLDTVRESNPDAVAEGEAARCRAHRRGGRGIRSSRARAQSRRGDDPALVSVQLHVQVVRTESVSASLVRLRPRSG